METTDDIVADGIAAHQRKQQRLTDPAARERLHDLVRSSGGRLAISTILPWAIVEEPVRKCACGGVLAFSDVERCQTCRFTSFSRPRGAR